MESTAANKPMPLTFFQRQVFQKLCSYSVLLSTQLLHVIASIGRASLKIVDWFGNAELCCFFFSLSKWLGHQLPHAEFYFLRTAFKFYICLFFLIGEKPTHGNQHIVRVWIRGLCSQVSCELDSVPTWPWK